MSSDFILPWLHAAGDDGWRHSMQSFAGNGTHGPWAFSFSGDYLDAEHVKAYRFDPATTTSHPQSLTFIGPNTVTTSQVIPTGQYVVIYRDTPKGTPLVDYATGAVMDETNLDTTNRQAVFAAAEMVDRFEAVNATVSQAVASSKEALDAAGEALDAANATAAIASAAATTATAAANQAQARWDDINSKFTVSTQLPSGGSDGDVWFQISTGV